VSTTVDVHHHSTPSGLIAEVRARGEAHGASVQKSGDGREWLVLADGSRSALPPERWDPAVRRAELEEAGINLALESISPTALFYRGSETDAEWFCRSVNDALADNAATSNGHVIGMGHVPLQFPALAVKELRRTVDELHFPAVQIGSNANDANLDDEQFFPVFEAAESLDLLVFVHPFDHSGGAEALRHYYLRNLIGGPQGTAIAVASVIFGGVLDRFPRLKLCFAHAGGSAPYIRGRWRHGHEVRQEPHARGANRPFDEYFGMLYFDSLSHDQLALEYLVKSVGVGRVMHGTDYPADMGSIKQVPLIRQLPGLSDGDKEAILGGNALRLIGRTPALAAR
jgi:aminocarboxymuconate-semialdehyde decarboxylase